MRIGIITGEYYPQEGGVGDFTRELGGALHRAGHEIHILTSGEEIGPPVRELGLSIYRHIPAWNWGAYKRILQWAQAIQPDALNLQYQAAAFGMRGAINLFPHLQRKHLPAPLVVTYHDLLPPYLFPKAGPLRQWSVWQLAQHSAGVIVTNDWDYNRLTAAIAKPALPPVRMIPIGSNIHPHSGGDPERWGNRMGAFLIGFFGFQNRNKGIETLLHALAKVRADGVDAQLLFIGGRTGSSDATNAAYAAEVDALIAELGLTEHVQQTGFIAPEEVSAALTACDVCALPYRNGVNLRHGTLHACLVHGKAIISTHPTIPTPQLRDHDNLLLISPDDPDALAAALHELHTDRELRALLGKRAATLAQEFSWKRIAGYTAEFFRSLQPST